MCNNQIKQIASIAIGAFFCLFLTSCITIPQIDPLKFPSIEFRDTDRILILAPHPDDEVLGCGGVIQNAASKNLPIKIVFLTYGDNNEWSFILARKHPVVIPQAVRNMGLVRRDEAINADKILGVGKENLIFLGYPDFKTLNIWNFYWGNSPPARGMLTNSRAVPYKSAFRYGAPYKGEEILKDIEAIIGNFKPTKVFVSHPADHNPDHRSFYLFAKVALWNLQNQISPEIYPYIVHFKDWPNPSGYRPTKTLAPPYFFKDLINWKINRLDDSEVLTKYQAIKADKSQMKLNSRFLNGFVRINELFGDFDEIVLSLDGDMLIYSEPENQDLINKSSILTSKQKAGFIGIQEKYIRLKDDNIEFTFKFSRPLARSAEISLRVFGYSFKQPFEKMPKLQIRIGPAKYGVYDKRYKISSKNVSVKRHLFQIVVSIPLRILGNPDKILTTSQSYLTRVPQDWYLWQVIDVNAPQKSPQ